MKAFFDGIVVGAGAAGGAAAYHLAAKGWKVLVLDAAQFPRPKPCGGGMAASVQRLFPFDLRPAVDSVIDEVRFSWCLADPVSAPLAGDSPFWIVRRSQLDATLMEQAQAVGASFEQGVRVVSANREGEHWQVQALSSAGESLRYRSRSLVVADGSESSLAAGLGIGPASPRYASTVSVQLEGEVASPQAVLFDFGLVRHGFCWAFPRLGGYSIGVGTFIGRQEANSDAVLSQLLPSLGFAADAGQRQAVSLRIWNGHHPLHGSGVNAGAVAVGDAASLCDPFLAEGLRPALLSGCLAAQALDRWLAGEQGALGEYTARVRREWGESMAWGKRIAQVFYRVPGVGYQLGIKRPTAPQRIAQILSGEMGYGDIAQRVIKRLLFQRN
ncbi:NAD(P)/FAD-dependent oxidoreductase [Cyanobium sp. WAJ14-Wanaka]|uniref:NAD(P)/FAD-dependent oxidoreductase n=1 Tax=Cyanobium sp. WAJ14-Wanaka TaxID=2823725 RepID=UPI0020CBC3C0|nr:geranylgeranyl reductase family protein [Cyanobium sp. WAJ14-Wanaka]MCP9774760.1 geranylgeranyl reductase family protein [Cyanobium sp. WAJ14-Wanaka]